MSASASRAHRRSSSPRVAPAPPAGAATVVWAGLVLVTVARTLAPLAPGMWAWGFDVLRYAPPRAAAILGTLALAACVPALAAPASAAIESAASRLARHPRGVTTAFAIAAAALVWLLDDRAWFLGDFILRVGAVERGVVFERFFPQALPLDVLLHGRLPELLALRSSQSIVIFNRALGALEAALLATLAAGFVRVLGLRGGAAVAVAATAFFGGTLTVFTGFGKSAGELCVIAAAIAVLGIASIRDGRRLLPLGIVVAIALVLHRSAILFLPALGAAWILAWQGAGRPRTPRLWVALAVPVVTLALIAPRIVHILRTFDRPSHVTSIGIGAQGGPLAAAFAPLHLIDLANLMVALAPLALLLPLLVAARRNRRPAREAVLLLVMVASFVPALLFAHPQQGLYRDWDVFAPAGTAIALLAAWLVADVLDREPRRAWLVTPLVIASLVPAILWLAHHHEVDRGLARARALAIGPPVREPDRRAQIWDFIGIRAFRLGRWDEAAGAYRASAAEVPQPRVLLQWGLAATLSEDYADARLAYRTLLARKPDEPIAWLGLAGAALRLRDSTATRQAMERLRGFQDDPAAVASLEVFLRNYPQVWPYPLGLGHRP